MVNALGGKRLLESFIFGIALDTMQLGSNAWHSWYDLDAAGLHAVEVDLI
jgi:hypothetical protein